MRGLRFCCSVVAVVLAAVAQQTPSTPAAPTQVAPAKPEPLKRFADAVKGATEIPGLFRLFRTEEGKLYGEILPSQFEKVYMLSLTCDSGLGERGLYAAEMCGETPMLFHKLGSRGVQLIARNPLFRAEEGTPMARAVARSFSDSVIGLAPVISQPHPERKSVVIDLGAVLLSDVPMLGYKLELTFRMPYRFDVRNSSIGTLKAFERNVEIETVAHYAADRPTVPPLLAPGAPQPRLIPPPGSLPDLRSMLLHLRYSISELPDEGYRPRLADDRVGFFVEAIRDYSDKGDVSYTPVKRYVNRWRLEKADVAAAVSKPKKPIVYWLENTIPVKYRAPIREGILLWNRAFERIGFRDAIEVREQADDADWDAADVRYNTVRWFAGVDAVFAQGPSRANPFTGELYDADIRFSESYTRIRRDRVVIESNPLSTSFDVEQPVAFRPPWSAGKAEYCTLMSDAIPEMAFGFELLSARGLEPDSPEADKLVNDYLRWIAAHEVGHTLGLRHNFRSSTIRPFGQMQNAEVTASEGLIGSVMDYTPFNIAPKGARQGEIHQSTLGSYDYWAIEYAYKPIDAATPEAELPELQKIASRAADPKLAYGTDEDAGGFGAPYELDPLANRFDLGSDPLQFYAHRIRLSREIWANMESKLGKPGQGYQSMRRSFSAALRQSGSALTLTAKYIGGVYHYRDHIGDPSGRLPFEPVPAARQKEALQLINENCFAPHAFPFSARLLNKLDVERLPDRLGPPPMSEPQDLPVHEAILSIQRALLDRIFHPVVLKRVSDNEIRYINPAERFRMSELFLGVQDAVWAETEGRGALSINSVRRNLQREHLRRMIGLLLRAADAPEDARTLSRHCLITLKDRLNAASARATAATPLEVRAHLAESIARVDEALKANQQRIAL